MSADVVATVEELDTLAALSANSDGCVASAVDGFLPLMPTSVDGTEPAGSAAGFGDELAGDGLLGGCVEVSATCLSGCDAPLSTDRAAAS